MLEKEAVEKGIAIEALKAEQKKIAKLVSLKDAFDFKLASRFAAIRTEALGKEILASIVVLDEKLEIIEEKYVLKPIRFPYIPGYRAYRELPAMLAVCNKLDGPPDVIFIESHGIAHPRGLGLASHLGVSLNQPVIGVANKILIGTQKNNEIILNNKKVASSLITKKGSRPIYISPGNMISLKTALEVTKRCLKEHHKLPEPIVQARKSVSKIKKELQK